MNRIVTDAHSVHPVLPGWLRCDLVVNTSAEDVEIALDWGKSFAAVVGGVVFHLGATRAARSSPGEPGEAPFDWYRVELGLFFPQKGLKRLTVRLYQTILTSCALRAVAASEVGAIASQATLPPQTDDEDPTTR